MSKRSSETKPEAPRDSPKVYRRSGSGQAPDPETLADVLKVMPKDAMEQRLGFALFTCARVWITVLIALYLTIISPWYARLCPLHALFVLSAHSHFCGECCGHERSSEA